MSPAPADGAARVLVVDDQPLNRDVLSRRVQREGLATAVAQHGREALAMLQAEPFDAVLLDVHMPEMDGLELLGRLKADPALAHIPVIMISAVDELDTIVRCLELGADDYLPKAFKPAILRARLRAALDRKRLHDAERRYAESLSRELTVGRRIQRDFLPLTLPRVDGLEVAAALESARQVSGDFYDAFYLSQHDAVFVAVGDVCGKGVGAALYMALFRSLLRASSDPILGGAVLMPGTRRSVAARALSAEPMDTLLMRVAAFTNDYIARIHDRANMFATVFLGVVRPETGMLEYVNAGHEPGLVLRHGDGSVRDLPPTGPALGLLPDAALGVETCQLLPGDRLLVLTDGVVEARNEAGEDFGEHRLRASLAGGSAGSLVDGVLNAVRDFTGGAEPHDDVTLLALARTR